MTKIELHLAYQKETGLGLESISNIIKHGGVEISMACQCPECDEKFEQEATGEIDGDLINYIQWLEEVACQGIPLIKGFVAMKGANKAMTDFFNATNKTR